MTPVFGPVVQMRFAPVKQRQGGAFPSLPQPFLTSKLFLASASLLFAPKSFHVGP